MMVHVHTIVFVMPVVQHWVERKMTLLGKHTHCVVSDRTCRDAITQHCLLFLSSVQSVIQSVVQSVIQSVVQSVCIPPICVEL